MKFHYYDANCLVKLVVNEKWSKELKNHFYAIESTVVTTSFCFYEALGVLKTKWVRKNREDSISKEHYLAASEELCALIEDGNLQLEELPFYQAESFSAAQEITNKYGIDLSDAFQLITLKNGMMAQLETTITPELITEDKEIRKAAKEIGFSALTIEQLNRQSS